MSKKILKRSLALGALMAFVITGSAYAENRTGDKASGWTLTGDYTANGIFDVYNGGDSNPKYPREGRAWNLEKYTLKVTGVNSYSNSKAAINIHNPEFTGKEGSVLQISNVDGSALEGKGVAGFGTIDVDKLIVNVTDVAIYRSDNFTDVIHKINANVIDLTSTSDNGIYLEGKHSKLTLNAVDILKINAYKDGIKVNGGNSATLTTGELYITAPNDERGAITTVTSSDEISVTATRKAIIDGDIMAKKDSIVSLTMNTVDSVFKGAVIGYKGEGEVGNVILGLNGGTWNMTKASTLNNVTFGKDSTLVIEGKTFDVNEDSAVYALNGAGDKATLTVENGAKLKINGITETTYNIAKGFNNLEGAVDKWEVSDINALMQGVAWTTKDGLQVTVTAKEAEDIAEDMGVSEVTGDFLSNLAKDAGASNVKEDNVTAEGKLKGLANATANSQNDKVIAKAAAQAAEAVQKMAEAGGNSATAAKVVTNVTGVTNQRLSLNNGNHNGNKGGHGVGLLEEGSGAAIWAQYVHGKDSVEDMPSEAGASSYEGQYNGIVMGVDFKKVGKFQSGIAFNYGEGDTNSVNTTSPTRSDYDFWGVGYYGNIRNADSNVIFDIGYAKTDSDVTNNVNIGGFKQTYEASPETTTWTAGVKVEKLYQNNNVQIVPYTGLRYMSIDPDDYSTKCGALNYNLERQDIWLLPVGVSIKQEIVNPNGWVVTPKVDLSYIWAFGDTDSSMETNTVFGSDNRPIGYDVMDDGSWMGLVGVEAAMDDWTFGVSYSYQKGDHSESKKWYVDAKYSF